MIFRSPHFWQCPSGGRRLKDCPSSLSPVIVFVPCFGNHAPFHYIYPVVVFAFFGFQPLEPFIRDGDSYVSYHVRNARSELQRQV